MTKSDALFHFFTDFDGGFATKLGESEKIGYKKGRLDGMAMGLIIGVILQLIFSFML